jgi:hypothetical protein
MLQKNIALLPANIVTFFLQDDCFAVASVWDSKGSTNPLLGDMN